MEHKIIGGMGIGILFIGAILAGLFLGRRLPDAFPIKIIKKKFRLLLLICVFLLLTATIAQYYLGNFMSDGKTKMGDVIFSASPCYVLFISVWIGSYLRHKQNLNHENL